MKFKCFKFNLLWLLLLPGLLLAEDGPLPQVTIADPFINLHTGPGASYPIFHVLDRGTEIIIEKRHTDWFKIRYKDLRGWASRDEMEKTLLPSGQQLSISDIQAGDFQQRDWEFGVMGGEFAKAPIISIYAGYAFNRNLSAELTYADSVGSVSSSQLIKASLRMHPFPDWSYSPYFSLGTGRIEVIPKATLVTPKDRTNQFSQVGIGLSHHIDRRFMIRLEVNEYEIFSASNEEDENEDITEWKAGFTIFF